MAEKKDKRYRVMYRFWLDLQKDDEDRLDEELHVLKAARKFQSTVRDGLRLILDLKAGRLDVLFELFPWVKTELQRQETPGEKALREQLTRMEQYMIQSGNRPMPMPSSGPKPLAAGPQAMNVPQNLDLPTFDDEDDADLITVKKAEGGGRQANENFLRAMQRLQDM